jgi:hypothetical protein
MYVGGTKSIQTSESPSPSSTKTTSGIGKPPTLPLSPIEISKLVELQYPRITPIIDNTMKATRHFLLNEGEPRYLKTRKRIMLKITIEKNRIISIIISTLITI